jgi:hypothetical protein
LSARSAAIARASTSVGPPAGNDTTTVTKRLGQFCADAAEGASANAVATRSARTPVGQYCIVSSIAAAGMRRAARRYRRTGRPGNTTRAMAAQAATMARAGQCR